MVLILFIYFIFLCKYIGCGLFILLYYITAAMQGMTGHSRQILDSG